MSLFRDDLTLQAFLLCVIAGACTAVLYDIFCFARTLPFLGRNVRVLLDILFCVLAAVIAFLVALPVSFGRLRIYQIAGQAAGIVVYRLSLGCVLRWLARRICRLSLYFSKRRG